MTAATQTIASWLLEQIAADEAVADDFHATDCDTVRVAGTPFPCTCGYPTRVLAQCAAFRTIVEMATNQHTSSPDFDEAVRALASIYADRDGWRDEWR